jgi:hypothetical protein
VAEAASEFISGISQSENRIFSLAANNTLAPFRIFSNFREDIRNLRCTTDENDTGDKLTTGVVDNGG